MYSQWTNITERDLLQKGTSYKRIKTALKLEKIVLNMTLPNIGSSLPSESSKKTKAGLDSSKGNNDRESVLNLSVMSLLAIISGQRPILTKARKSIANWKIRKNQVLGFKVTLRGQVALDFLDKTVRFQNINERDMFASSPAQGLKSKSQTTDSNASNSFSSGNYSLQSLGNLSIGIKNINLYPELEDLWIAQNLGQKTDLSAQGKSNSNRFLGLDLSLNFKNSKELSQILAYILRKPGGKKLSEDYFKNISAFPAHIKTNKHVLSLKNVLLVRKLYLTSLGLFVSE